MDDVSRRRWLADAVRDIRADPRFWYVPHAKQLAFHACGTTARERLFLAGNRVGKTLAGAAETGFHLTGCYPPWWQGTRFDRPISAWAASVTREATRDILQETYLGPKGSVPARLVLSTVNKQGISGAVDTVRIRHVSGGISTLGFKSYDQGRPSFQGTSREVIHLDEEPPLEVYEECLLRTLTVGGHMLLTMTPLLGLTDMVRHFGLPSPGRSTVTAGWAEAPHLAAHDVDRLRKSLRSHEIRAREFGEPSIGRGRVYPLDEEAIAVPRFEILPHWKRCVGVDFGWTNPTAAVWLAHDPDKDIVYLYDCYRRAEAPPAEHALAIKARGAWIPAVCDPAGQAVSQRDGASLLEVYAGLGLRFSPADNAMEAGLMTVLERFRTGKLKVFADLDDWWREFRLYARDGRGRIIKRDDHLLDATRYAVVSGLALASAEGIGRLAPRVPARRGDGWTF